MPGGGIWVEVKFKDYTPRLTFMQSKIEFWPLGAFSHFLSVMKPLKQFIHTLITILEQRKAEASKIRTKYPDRIPVSKMQFKKEWQPSLVSKLRIDRLLFDVYISYTSTYTGSNPSGLVSQPPSSSNILSKFDLLLPPPTLIAIILILPIL